MEVTRLGTGQGVAGEAERCCKENFCNLFPYQDPDAGCSPAVPNAMQEGTSADRTSLSSESTQQDLNTCPTESLNITHPDQGEPSSNTADMTEAHPMEGEERGNDCIYLKYRLPMYLCPTCYLVQGFQYLDNLSRHLKRIYSRRIAFWCAFCDLPFKTQKKCKSYQVTCKGHLTPEEANSNRLCCPHRISVSNAETLSALPLTSNYPNTPVLHTSQLPQSQYTKRWSKNLLMEGLPLSLGPPNRMLPLKEVLPQRSLYWTLPVGGLAPSPSLLKVTPSPDSIDHPHRMSSTTPSSEGGSLKESHATQWKASVVFRLANGSWKLPAPPNLEEEGKGLGTKTAGQRDQHSPVVRKQDPAHIEDDGDRH
ncbi:hypothetical protein UY3_18351 [Chelonia mydas]|uniref:Uncharacterized protein n=1 Tax=Chelonia mydas TaxID=8469 RepID=M7AP83_CHEMY|nr:hypothetical protein UY3_18351 [Chelonia mydas]